MPEQTTNNAQDQSKPEADIDGLMEAVMAANHALEEETGFKSAALLVYSDMSAQFKELADNKKLWESTKGLVGTTTAAAKVFANPNATPVDIASHSLKLSGAVATTISTLGSTLSFLGPVGKLFGLIGALVGAFSSRPKTNYFQVLQRMLDQAINRLETDLTRADLHGALEQLLVTSRDIGHILDSRSSITPGDALSGSYRVEEVITVGAGALGRAWTIIEMNVDKSHEDNWDNAALALVDWSDLVNARLTLLLQAIAYFSQVYQDPADGQGGSSSVERVHHEMLNFMAVYDARLRRFLMPDLAHLGLAIRLWRLDADQFTKVSATAASLSGDEYWPHAPVRREGGATRLTSLMNAKNADPKVLAIRKSDGQRLGVVPGKQDENLCVNFSLWASTDEFRPGPYYRWWARGKGITDSQSWLDRSYYIIELRPSDAEMRKYDLPTDRELLILGDPDDDKSRIYYLKDGEFDRGNASRLTADDESHRGRFLWKIYPE